MCIFCVVLLVIAVMIGWLWREGMRGGPPFRLGGFSLGSYDPNMYSSEITRGV